MFDFILAQNKFRYCDSNPLEQVVMVSPVWTDFAKFAPPLPKLKTFWSFIRDLLNIS